MKKDFVMPILVLALICLAISAALAFTDSITRPIIKSAADERANEAKYQIIPDATGFELLELAGLPDSVTEVHKSTNDVGYIFMITAPGGYGGSIEMICGIDPDGKIISAATLAHSETKGLGTKIDEPDYANQYIGQDSALSGISAIAGATISSNAYYDGIKSAFAAFEIARGVD